MICCWSLLELSLLTTAVKGLKLYAQLHESTVTKNALLRAGLITVVPSQSWTNVAMKGQTLQGFVGGLSWCEVNLHARALPH